jgi:hypothetical protein
MRTENPSEGRRDADLQPDADINAGAVGPDDADPARRALRAEVGKYVSLADFPATGKDLIRVAEENGAPDQVLTCLRGLGSAATFEHNRDVWIALDLEATERF